jgi:hypothetical protein
MFEITLCWKRDGEDVNLGTGAHPLAPPVGALVIFPCEHGVAWRVTQHNYALVMPGSVTWKRWKAGQPHGGGVLHVFVQPAEGAFEP